MLVITTKKLCIIQSSLSVANCHHRPLLDNAVYHDSLVFLIPYDAQVLSFTNSLLISNLIHKFPNQSSRNPRTTFSQSSPKNTVTEPRSDEKEPTLTTSNTMLATRQVATELWPPRRAALTRPSVVAS